MPTPSYTWRLSNHAYELDADGHHDLDDMTNVDLSTPPTTNDLLTWNGTTWIAQAPSASGGSLTVKDEGSALATAATSLDFVGAGVVASGTGAAKTIAIAGGGGGGVANAVNYIEPAAAPNADDDEGTVAATNPIGGWTTLGTVTTLNRNTTYADRIYLSVPANSGTRVDGIYKAHTLANGEAFVARVDVDTIRANYNRIGIFMGVASAAGRIDTMGVVSNGGNHQSEVLAMTDATTYSSTITSVNIARPTPTYLAIRRNSAISYDYLWGFATPAGIRWTFAFGARDPAMTQAVCGLFANAQNGSIAVEAVFKWARFYAALPGLAP